MKPNEMTDQELNEAIAIEVMGWHEFMGWWCEERLSHRNAPDGKEHWRKYKTKDWNPTHDLNQAWMLVEKFKGTSLSVHIYCGFALNGVQISKNLKEISFVEFKDNPARALSEACLTAKRGES